MVATKAAMPPKAMIARHEVSTGANHSRKKQQARKKADPAHWIGFRPTTSTAAIISTACAQKTASVSIGGGRMSKPLNDAREPWGPAAADTRIATELDGWSPSAQRAGADGVQDDCGGAC